MNEFVRVTEQPSFYHHLEKMSVLELLTHINQEDQTVPHAVARAIPQIEALVQAISDKMLMGGRLFYIGAGTSGRLAVVVLSVRGLFSGGLALRLRCGTRLSVGHGLHGTLARRPGVRELGTEEDDQ